MEQETGSHPLLTHSILTEPLLSALHHFIFALSFADSFLLHMFPALNKGEIQQKASKLEADRRFYNIIELSSKAALLMCDFVSAVTHA